MSLIRPSPPDDKARQRRCCSRRPVRGPRDRFGGVLAEMKGAPVGRVAGEPPGSDATGPERLLRRLGELGIAAPTVPYPAHRTVEQGRQRRGALAGAFTKNLLLQDKKGRLFLFTVAEDRVLDLRTAHTRIDALPRGNQVVAYCRGPCCVYADQAVDHAVADGRAAARLADGFPEWAAAGLPVEMGT